MLLNPEVCRIDRHLDISTLGYMSLPSHGYTHDAALPQKSKASHWCVSLGEVIACTKGCVAEIWGKRIRMLTVQA